MIEQLAAPKTAAEYRAWWEANTPVPYGFCWCGCGSETEPYRQNYSFKPDVKGEPRRYVAGHSQHVNLAVEQRLRDEHRRRWEVEHPDTPYGYCQCGCGTFVGFHEKTNLKAGQVKGQSKRFAPWHHSRIVKGPSPQTRADYRKEWEENASVPYGFCWCGCGGKTTLAKQSDAKQGHVNGEPMRFLAGHRRPASGPSTLADYRRLWEENTDIPYGTCWCGCGNETPVAKTHNRKQGYFKGAPVRFVPGHAAKARHATRRAALGEPNPSGLCMCGCGQKTALAKQSHTEMGWVKDKPIQYISGHGPRKLSPEQEAELCRRYSEGEKPKALSRAFGVSVSGLVKILARNGVDRRYWKPVSTSQAAEICRRYESGDEIAEIAADAGINLTSIYGVLQRNGIQARRNDGMPEAQQLEVCRRYLAGESTYALAREFGVSDGTIGKVLTQRGVQKRTASEVHRRYSCDHSFFDTIDTEVKAYWLGFVAADGNVYNNILKIALSSRDREHLVRFKGDLHSDHPISNYVATTKPPGSKKAKIMTVSSVSISSPQLTGGLAAYGIVPRKTFTNRWPDFLPGDLLRHFLRGYFDGDGCFHVSANAYVRKKDGQRRAQLHWSTVGSEAFCSGARTYLMDELKLNEVRLGGTKSPGIVTLRYGATLVATKIYDLLYKDATVYLPRKREVAEPYVRSVSAFTEGLVAVNRRGLRALREKRGLTLESLAARSGVHWSTIFELETDDRLTDPALAQRIAAALDVTYAELCVDPSQPNPPAKKNPAPLSPKEVREVRQRLADGEADHRGLAFEYGVGKSTIGRVVRKEGRWANIS
jgi:transcriptional regulator with XRE-family HTH domain